MNASILAFPSCLAQGRGGVERRGWRAGGARPGLGPSACAAGGRKCEAGCAGCFISLRATWISEYGLCLLECVP